MWRRELDSTSKNLSQAQSQAVALAISNGIAQALTGALGVVADNTRANAMYREAAPQTTGLTCTPTSTGESCTLPIDATFNCSGGGTLAISGTLSGTLDNSGDGSAQAQLSADPSKCSVDGIVLNGDPSVNVASTVTITADAPVWPITGMETGGVTYGPNPSGSCQFNVTYTVNQNLSCTVSGTACGQPVSGSC